MSEFTEHPEVVSRNPELLACQLAVKELSDEILTQKPEHVRLTYWEVASQADPNETQAFLRSAFSDLMLRDGDTLSAVGPREYYPELDLFVDRALLEAVSLRAWGWEFDKLRIDRTSASRPPYEVIEYPGEKDWVRQLDIRLHYSNGIQTAVQELAVQTGSEQAGHLPSISRDVVAPAYAEMGYEGHNQKWRKAKSEEEIQQFVHLARNLLGKLSPS